MSNQIIIASMEDLVNAIKEGLNPDVSTENNSVPVKKHYVYGLQGLADLLGCSRVTASRIKSSGVIDAAISQVGRIIITDADLALDLLNVSKRRCKLRGGYKTKKVTE